MIDKTGSMHAQLVMDQIKAYQTRVNQTREPEAAIAPTEIQKPTFGETINQMVTDVNSAQMLSAGCGMPMIGGKTYRSRMW